MPSEQETQLQRACAAFLLDRAIMGCTNSTVFWYRRYLGHLVTWLTGQGVTKPSDISLDLLRAYIVHLQARGLAPKTIHHYANVAKVWGKWLAAEKLVAENPASRLPWPKVPKKVLPALTKEDVNKLLAAADQPRDKALLLFMLDTGARNSETVAVNVGDVDLKTGAVTIAQGKGQKGRIVYLGLNARKALQRYLLQREDATGPLWTNLHTGERLTTWGVTMVLRVLSRETGVHVHPHMLRRTFAVMSLRAGMDVARLAALLGHSDLATVSKYLALAQEDLADAHQQHGAVDALLSKKGR